MTVTASASPAPSPGRSGDPDRGLRTDPRIGPELLAFLTRFQLDGAAAGPPVTRGSSDEAAAAFMRQWDLDAESLYEAMPNELPGDADSVMHVEETISGVDGNPIALRIYRPADGAGPLPCVVYLHGGGMTISRAFGKIHRRWSRDLAATGMVVVGVDFRNACTPAGTNPFPAGLNDCSSALAWLHGNRTRLGITTIVLQGESGGANLALATALKAKRENALDSIDGVYAMVPYISGGYGWTDERKHRDLPSMIENDGYFINCAAMDVMVRMYDPTGANAENPLCWPYFATEEDLRGLPPHVISVDELDPLRDEGQAYFHKLLHAGVPAVGRINLGLVHAAEMLFRQAVPRDYLATVRDINQFAADL